MGMKYKNGTWEWQGGDMIWITYELLEDVAEGIVSNRNPQPGDVFTFGPYLLRCTARDDARQAIEANRLANGFV
jgi:hypothetical protein